MCACDVGSSHNPSRKLIGSGVAEVTNSRRPNVVLVCVWMLVQLATVLSNSAAGKVWRFGLFDRSKLPSGSQELLMTVTFAGVRSIWFSACAVLTIWIVALSRL